MPQGWAPRAEAGQRVRRAIPGHLSSPAHAGTPGGMYCIQSHLGACGACRHTWGHVVHAGAPEPWRGSRWRRRDRAARARCTSRPPQPSTRPVCQGWLRSQTVEAVSYRCFLAHFGLSEDGQACLRNYAVLINGRFDKRFFHHFAYSVSKECMTSCIAISQNPARNALAAYRFQFLLHVPSG